MNTPKHLWSCLMVRVEQRADLSQPPCRTVGEAARGCLTEPGIACERASRLTPERLEGFLDGPLNPLPSGSL